MRQLLLFLFRYRAFIFFLFLETFCGWLIVRNNTYQSARYFNTSNAMVGSFLNLSNNIFAYFELRQVNESLIQENALLKTQIERFKNPRIIGASSDPSLYALPRQYEFVSAKVVNNSVNRPNNSMTINKGVEAGIEPGMGIIVANGIVGKVKYVGNKFSVVTPVIQTGVRVSSRVDNKVEICTVEWDGKDPLHLNLAFVPRHIQLAVGDSVFTSGYNAVFPPDLFIGVIDETTLPDDSQWHLSKVKLSTDFSSLSYVMVIKNSLAKDKNQIENLIDE